MNIHPWPQAILHLDADSFFASCEQALNPQLKGQPVVTGAERNIVSAASYEAKALNIQRGTPLNQIKRDYPQVHILPSDYESYSLFSKRMFTIMRRYCPQVEEYSIDEAFADLTGMRRPLHKSYRQIAQQIQNEIEQELNITVSVGVSLSKSLAKLAANLNKPSGLTIVSGKQIDWLLKQIPLHKVWGFGSSTTAYLQKFNLRTVYDFAQRSQKWVKQHLNKTGLEIWQEMHGEYIYAVNPQSKKDYQSISKTKTFTPPSNQLSYLQAQLMRNLESACIKARRHNLAAQKIVLYLKKQDFTYKGVELQLNQATNNTLNIIPLIKQYLPRVFNSQFYYRATGVILRELIDDSKVQQSLFSDKLAVDKIDRLTETIDHINQKCGKHTIHQASSLPVNPAGRGQREPDNPRWRNTFKGETKRQHLNLPRLSIKVK